jgi:hypothetical protein
MMNVEITGDRDKEPSVRMQFLHIQWNKDVLSKKDFDKRLEQLNIKLPSNQFTKYLEKLPAKPFEFERRPNLTVNRKAYQNQEEGAFITIK